MYYVQIEEDLRMIRKEDLKVGDILYLEQDQNPPWDGGFIVDLKNKILYIDSYTNSMLIIKAIPGEKITNNTVIYYQAWHKSIYEHCHKLYNIYDINYKTFSFNRFSILDD